MGLGLGALLLVSNCGGGPTAPSLRDAETLTREGWAAFETGEFARAAAKFDSAQKANPDFAEAYNGAGWAYARLGEFQRGGENFDMAINLAPDKVEPRAGAALTDHALGRFQDAIEHALFVLSKEPDFVFSHDASIDALDIRITLALSYFAVADFVDAAAQMDIIDPAHSPHSTDPQLLIREIMRFMGLIR